MEMTVNLNGFTCHAYSLWNFLMWKNGIAQTVVKLTVSVVISLYSYNLLINNVFKAFLLIIIQKKKKFIQKVLQNHINLLNHNQLKQFYPRVWNCLLESQIPLVGFHVIFDTSGE